MQNQVCMSVIFLFLFYLGILKKVQKSMGGVDVDQSWPFSLKVLKENSNLHVSWGISESVFNTLNARIKR